MSEDQGVVLKLAFWEAMERCDDGKRPYLGDASNGDAGLIDGYIPEEFWGHMADALKGFREEEG